MHPPQSPCPSSSSATPRHGALGLCGFQSALLTASRAALLTLAVPACSPDRLTTPDALSSSLSDAVTLIGAGDIGSCSSSGRDEATAKLILAEPEALVFTAGDNAYPDASPADFANCYDGSWGQFKGRTYPTLGNHEFRAFPDAAPYFDYFNGPGVDSGRAGRRGQGWYAVDHGAWRLLFLDSHANILMQAAWMRTALSQNPTRCQLAIWHRPRYTSGPLPTKKTLLQPFWDLLAEFRVEIAIAGHDHHYERFNPDQFGIRQFTVGGGGHGSINDFVSIHGLSAKRIARHGVLWLELAPDSYRWEYREITGLVTDSGEGLCHPEPEPAPPEPSPITLAVTGTRIDSFYRNDLRWTGAAGDSVEVWKDGALKKRELNDGRYINQQLYTGPATFRYRICERGASVCSNEATVSYP